MDVQINVMTHDCKDLIFSYHDCKIIRLRVVGSPSFSDLFCIELGIGCSFLLDRDVETLSESIQRRIPLGLVSQVTDGNNFITLIDCTL